MLKLIYRRYYCRKEVYTQDERLGYRLDTFEALKKSFDEILPEAEQEKVIMRLILSIKNISGGYYSALGRQTSI